MINSTIIMGRITHDLDMRVTPSGTNVCQFTVAVERNFAEKDGSRQSDFISCVAWRQNAEFITRYFGKGRMIAITGHLQSRTFDDKNGSKHYVTELIVEQASFTGEPKPYQQNNGYDPDVIGGEGVPF